MSGKLARRSTVPNDTSNDSQIVGFVPFRILDTPKWLRGIVRVARKRATAPKVFEDGFEYLIARLAGTGQLHSRCIEIMNRLDERATDDDSRRDLNELREWIFFDEPTERSFTAYALGLETGLRAHRKVAKRRPRKTRTRTKGGA